MALCPKIPTGGDETLLATKVLDTVNSHYRKRRVFDICSEHAARKDWADFVPAMRDNDKVVKFEIVDEDEWERPLNSMLAV